MEYLNRINSTEDLKKLDVDELSKLSKELRRFIVKTISKNGGHLSPNLGVVELSVALEYVFNSSKDKLIFDVGHQAYVHKILTGRRDQFSTIREFEGIAGFPKMSESETDAFDVGHSSTSISLANGFCTARDLQGEDYNVVSIIGDGAMTGGMVFEALNNIGRSKQKVIIILNDNQMSISENVGAISKTLSNFRTSEKYSRIKSEINMRLNDDLVTNKYIKKSLKIVKDSMNRVLVDGQLFEQLGLTYIGPINGHNIEELITTLNRAKKMNEPILLHVRTIKGKGYKPAQENPSKFHGVSPFSIKTGEVQKSTSETYSNIVGDKFMRLMASNKKIVLVSAAMTSGTGISKVQERYNDRVFDVGICEQHATTFCASMSKAGLTPVFLVYSTFLQRAYDQILHDVCITNRNVVFMIDRSGIVGADGETHQGLFDTSFLSHMPNMNIIAPKSKEELDAVIDFAIALNKPVAIKYPRGKAFTYDKCSDIILGESEQVFGGDDDIIIISVGHMFNIALEVYDNLKTKGYNPTLINARFLKPIDEHIAKNYANSSKIICIEENVFNGGFAHSLSSKLLENKFKGQYYPFTFGDNFIEQGTPEQLREKYGLTVKNIIDTVL